MKYKLYKTYSNSNIKYASTKYKDKVTLLKNNKLIIIENINDVIEENIDYFCKFSHYRWKSKEVINIVKEILNNFNIKNNEIELVDYDFNELNNSNDLKKTIIFEDLNIDNLSYILYQHLENYTGCRLKLVSDNYYFIFNFGLIETNIEKNILINIFTKYLIN